MPVIDERSGQHDLIKRFLNADQRGDVSRFRFWEELVHLFGDLVHSEIIYFLTRQSFDSAVARAHWQGINAHRKVLERELGRDVGVQAAMCDFFINIQPQMSDPVLVEDNLLRHKEQCAVRDDLTGLYNRRFFRGILKKQVAEAIRFKQQFGLLMMDLDRFKAYNDSFGHSTGDRALTDLSQILLNTARTVDYVVRYGGEEFVVLLPQTDKGQALAAAHRHCRAVEMHHFPRQEELPARNLTVSVGVACFPGDAHCAVDLVEKADQALYSAKIKGRNQVVASESERRRHLRAEYRTPVEFRYTDAGDEYQTGETVDISFGGIAITAEVPLDTGRPVEIIINTPDQEYVLRLEGRTVRTEHHPALDKPYQAGVSIPENKRGNPFRNLVEDRLNTIH